MYKDGPDEPICRAAMEIQTLGTDLGTPWAKERVGQMERVAWKHIHLPYIKQIASGNLLHDAELEPGFCDNLEGWDRGSRGKGHMYTYGWFTLMNGRNQHNIVKQLSSN